MPRDLLLSPRALLALLLVFALAWFGTLDQRKLIKPDEGRYAEIAREMAQSGDFVTPRLNGIKYFEKPPLQYWATALAFRAFGEHDWSARLWPALTGFASVLLVGLAGSLLWGATAGIAAAAVAGSSLLMVMIGHLNTLDMGLTAGLTLALAGFLLANRADAAPASRRRWMLLAWAGLAAGVLAKGLVAVVLTGTTLVAYSLLCRDASPWRRLQPLSGVALFLALTAPWFVAVSLANPEFARFFFIHEHFERFLTKTHGRYQPWWYFLPILALGALPWTLMAAQAALARWRSEARGAFQPARFLLIWVAVVFGFFSASGSKLPSYILPLLPALALIAGAWLAGVAPKTLRAHCAVVALAAAAALPFLLRVGGMGDEETPAPMLAAYMRWLLASAATILGAALLATWFAHRQRRFPAVLTLALGSLAGGSGVLLGHENLAHSNSSYHLAQKIAPQLPPGVPFYSVAMYEQTLPYYLKRTLTLVDYRDEMGFGLSQQPQLWVPTVAEFVGRWRADADAFAVMLPDMHRQLAAQGLPMQVVAQDTRRIVVRKTATEPK